ncbi:MAG: acyl carrier protein [Gammaproteobacteria bacterium]|nr:acyl carrier protein [Gammaproteobacteria bacterium]
MSVNKVREILAQHGRLSVPVETLQNDSDLYGAGLTSLATVGLMLALEDGFGIEFPDSALSRKTFASINAINDTVSTLAAR